MPTSLPALATMTRAHLIGNRENPIIRALTDLKGIFPEPVGHFLRDEHDFMLPAALGLLQDQFAVLEIPQSEFKDLTDSHTASGHQFQHQPVPCLGGPENDLVHSLFFDDFPFRGHSLPIELADHGRVAWIYKAVVQIVADEIEIRTKVGVTDAFGVGPVALGESIKKPQDIIGCHLVDFVITEFLAEPIDDRLVGPDRIFFWNGPGGNPSRWLPPLRLSWLPPLVRG